MADRLKWELACKIADVSQSAYQACEGQCHCEDLHTQGFGESHWLVLLSCSCVHAAWWCVSHALSFLLHPMHAHGSSASWLQWICCICTTKNLCVCLCLPISEVYGPHSDRVFWQEKKSISLCARGRNANQSLLKTPWGYMLVYSVNLWISWRRHCKQNMTLFSKHQEFLHVPAIVCISRLISDFPCWRHLSSHFSGRMIVNMWISPGLLIEVSMEVLLVYLWTSFPHPVQYEVFMNFVCGLVFLFACWSLLFLFLSFFPPENTRLLDVCPFKAETWNSRGIV